MHAQVDEPADHAAAGHQQHAVQSHRGIERADLERRVDQDQQRPADAHDHVGEEPPLHLAQAVQRPHVLAQRIAEQRQHHHAAGHTQPVADVVARLEVTLTREQPGAADERADQQIDPEIARRVMPRARLRLRGGGHGGFQGAAHGWT
jgi:hypothetical protein